MNTVKISDVVLYKTYYENCQHYFTYLYYKNAWEIIPSYDSNFKLYETLGMLLDEYQDLLYDGYTIRICYYTPKQKRFILKNFHYYTRLLEVYIDNLINFDDFENEKYVITDCLNFVNYENKVMNAIEIRSVCFRGTNKI
jgi:hypothetical protein